MYPKHLNQTNRTMNVTIEHVFCRYSDEAEEIYFPNHEHDSFCN